MKRIVGFAFLLAFFASTGLYAAPKSVREAEQERTRAQRELASKQQQLRSEQQQVAALERELAQAKTDNEKAQKQAELNQVNSSCTLVYMEIDGLYALIAECDTIISQGQ